MLYNIISYTGHLVLMIYQLLRSFTLGVNSLFHLCWGSTGSTTRISVIGILSIIFIQILEFSFISLLLVHTLETVLYIWFFIFKTLTFDIIDFIYVIYPYRLLTSPVFFFPSQLYFCWVRLLVFLFSKNFRVTCIGVPGLPFIVRQILRTFTSGPSSSLSITPVYNKLFYYQFVKGLNEVFWMSRLSESPGGRFVLFIFL